MVHIGLLCTDKNTIHTLLHKWPVFVNPPNFQKTNYGGLTRVHLYYSSVITSVQRATENAIPSTVHWQNSKHNVPGWNEFVDKKHNLPRQAFLHWLSAGRPHDNFFLPRMHTWAAFKHTLRYCRTHEEQIRADAYAASLEAHDSKKFWEQLHALPERKVNARGL